MVALSLSTWKDWRPNQFAAYEAALPGLAAIPDVGDTESGSGVTRRVHVLVVHLGLIPASRERQVVQLRHYIEREIPHDAPVVVAGDFNDWGARLTQLLGRAGLHQFEGGRTPTYPSRLPLAQLDHVYARGLRPLSAMVPRGRIWRQMSDHLPVIADLLLPPEGDGQSALASPAR